MSRHAAHLRLLFVLGAGLLGASGLAGCATEGRTAAAVAGGLLSTGLGVQALTGSKLEVTVDMYAPTAGQQSAMRLNHRPALMQWIHDRYQADADPVQHPTAENIIAVSARLRPVMTAFEKNIATATRSSNQLKSLVSQSADPANSPLNDVIAVLDAQCQSSIAVIDAWRAFDTAVQTNLDRINAPTVLPTLAFKLSVLRDRADPKRRFDTINQNYLYFLRTQMRAALVQDVSAAMPPNDPAIGNIGNKMDAIKDDPSAGGAERIAKVLDAVREALAFVPGESITVDRTLSAFNFPFNSQQLIALGSREAIIAALTVVPDAAHEDATATPTARELSSDRSLSAVYLATYLDRFKALAHNSTFFNRATADVNLGPISNEVQQVLQAAGRALSVISDPANADRWRLGTAYAVSDGGPGNHNSIIYFENMGLPVVKSSAFDPTKFVVAQGALYRQVFSAAVAAFGVPLPSTAGAAGVPDMQSSNIIATRARIRNAEKQTSAVRQKILDALKVAIDQQKKVQSGNWNADKPAIIQEAQKALQGAASQLEASGGTN